MNKLLSLIILLVALTGLQPHSLLAQSRTVSGMVTQAEDKAALPGVNVLVKGTSTGAISDANGNYSIGVPDGAVLVFSFIGFTPQEVPVGDRNTINVELAPLVTELTQVVVTGYNTQQKRDIIGSIASVTPDKFKDIPVVGIDQALQGQAAGVQVTQSSGTPGGGISVRVRGSTSISASNRPLFIVDGVPVEDGGLGLREFGGQNDNALALINPNDIESIQVLKDASAKAIYGSRAANGVVLVTTKRGRANARTTLTAEVQRGIIDPVSRPDLLNATELLELQREAVINGGGDPVRQGLIPGVNNAVDTDWLDAIFRRGIYQQYQTTASGGNDKTRFYASLNYRDEEGVQLNNRFLRYTGTLNLDHTATPKLSFGSNLTLARSRNDRVKGDNFLDGVYSGAVRSLPYYTPYNEQGQLIGPNSPGYAAFPNFNPVGQAVLPRFETYATKILGGIFADYAFLPRLRFRTKISIDYNAVTDDQFEPSTTAIGGYLQSVGGKGYGIYGSGTYSTLINSNTVTYGHDWNDAHHFSALVGNEILQRVERTAQVAARLFPRDDFSYINSPPPDNDQIATVDQGSSFINRSGLLSFFGEFKYDYREKYLFSITARQDGSSRFGRERRFGFFPSFSAGWRISAEPFMAAYTFVDDLKLRASYGFTGNERIGDFEFLGTFSGATYSGSSGLAPNNLENASLQWESTREFNLGLDLSVLNGRVGLTFDVYNNMTSNLLYDRPVPFTTGFGAFTGNIGQVANRGIEVGLNTVNTEGAFRWSTNFNLSHNVNEVVDIADSLPVFRGYTVTPSGSTSVVLEGQPLGTFWGLRFRGVDVATGDAIYDDINGDGAIDEDDGTVIGNAQPVLIGGITNRFSWKGFDLSAFFQFSYGNDILNFSNQGLLNAGTDLANNQVRAALRRWQKPGDITDVPRYEYRADQEGSSFNNYHSSRLVEDGSYLRLKNISLGYNLPTKYISRFKLSNVRAYVSATNLWTLTRYTGPDPEVSTLDGSTTAQGIDFYTFPQIRTVIGGLTIGF